MQHRKKVPNILENNRNYPKPIDLQYCILVDHKQEVVPKVLILTDLVGRGHTRNSFDSSSLYENDQCLCEEELRQKNTSQTTPRPARKGSVPAAYARRKSQKILLLSGVFLAHICLLGLLRFRGMGRLHHMRVAAFANLRLHHGRGGGFISRALLHRRNETLAHLRCARLLYSGTPYRCTTSAVLTQKKTYEVSRWTTKGEVEVMKTLKQLVSLHADAMQTSPLVVTRMSDGEGH